MADKKLGDPNEKPKGTMGLVGIGMIVLASVWLLWSAVLRPETDKEKKDRMDTEAEKARDEARKVKKAPKPPPPPAE